jgi:hypothetical protein
MAYRFTTHWITYDPRCVVDMGAVRNELCRPCRGLMNCVAAFFPRLAPWATLWRRYRG